MKDYTYYLNKLGEIGYVDEIVHSLAYVEGLPKAQPYETVMFESGSIGYVLSLTEKHAEVLLLSFEDVKAGSNVARTGQLLQFPADERYLGKVVNPLGYYLDGTLAVPDPKEFRGIDEPPMSILGRAEIKDNFETGVKLVDMIVPLGKGQRELVIGDRKTGKTLFLMQTMINQAKKGVVVIYAAIGKRQQEVQGFLDTVKKEKISDRVVLIVTGSADPAGLTFLAPYSAMTLAEYFRDMGQDTLVILDDLTAHAKYYREVSLLAKRFPGRSSYPGDVFYVHARLLERAGNFEKASITCLPVAESIMGDLSGYIQTNLMAMTDGHIFFDVDRYNQGIRPAVNPFLSVTRVGLQAQSPLIRDMNRQIASYLVRLENLKDFMHFGAEISEQVKQNLELGMRVSTYFEQDHHEIIPLNLSAFMIASIWGGYAKGVSKDQVPNEYKKIREKYQQNATFREAVDNVILGSPSFQVLVTNIKQQGILNS